LPSQVEKCRGKTEKIMKQYEVTIEEKKYVKFSIDSPENLQDLEEAARCRAIRLGYNPDDIVSIIEETPVREEGDRK
jgi:ferritin-like protein